MELEQSKVEAIKTFDKNYIHASNISKKIDNKKNLEFLADCIDKYLEFDKKFESNNLQKKVEAWNSYLKFVRSKNPFSAQSKFDSTILEETIFRLFIHLQDEKIKVGGAKAYSNLYFSPSNFNEFKISDEIKTNCKDQDFAIYKDVELKLESGKNISMSVPVVAFECKTYLDKTMLESSVATAEKIKTGNPSCRFCIITEWYSVDKNVDIRSSRIDQIYVLKKDANKSNQNERDIEVDVVERIIDDTTMYLKSNWINVEESIKNGGIVL